MATPIPVSAVLGFGFGSVGYNVGESAPSAHAFTFPVPRNGVIEIYNEGAAGLAFGLASAANDVIAAPWFVIPPGQSLSFPSDTFPVASVGIGGVETGSAFLGSAEAGLSTDVRVFATLHPKTPII
jgi:hypothetical protein